MKFLISEKITPIAYYFRSRHPRLVSSFNYKGIPSAEAIKSYKKDGTILSKWLDVSVTKNMMNLLQLYCASNIFTSGKVYPSDTNLLVRNHSYSFPSVNVRKLLDLFTS